MAPQLPERWDAPSPSMAGPAPASASAPGAIIQRHSGCAGTGRACGSKAPGAERG